MMRLRFCCVAVAGVWCSVFTTLSIAADDKYVEMDTPARFEINCPVGGETPSTISIKWDGKTLTQPYRAKSLTEPTTFTERSAPGNPSPSIGMRFQEKIEGSKKDTRIIVLFDKNGAAEGVGWTYIYYLGDRLVDAQDMPFVDCKTTLAAPK